MSHNRHAYAGHANQASTFATAPIADEQILSSHRTAQQVNQPVYNHHVNQQVPRPLRTSPSHSTLADSIRALRESSTVSSKSIATKPASNSSVESLASRRKAANPSPLQQDSSHPPSTKLYLREGIHSPLSPNSLHSFALPKLTDLPSSPKDRLDALFAPSSGSPDKQYVGAVPSRKASDSTGLRQPRSYGQLRNPSVPSSLNALGETPPLSPASVTTSKADIGVVMPRNSSIDSTVSSISSNTSQTPRSHPQSNGKGNAEEDFDPSAIITQAGSVEAALYALWKDNKNAANHNSQLWRLVEKQRSILLGLQKDLDKACKEKEKFRKKLKDHLSTCSSGTIGFPQADAVRERNNDSVSPAPSEPASDQSSKTASVTPKAREITELSSPPSSENPSPKMTTSSQFAAQQNDPAPKHTPIEHEDKAMDPDDKRRTTVNLHKSSQSSTVVSGTASPFGSDNTSVDASPVTSTSVRGEHSLERMETPLTDPSAAVEQSPVEKDQPARKIETYRPTGLSLTTAKPTPPPLLTPPNPPSVAVTGPTPKVDAGSFPSPPKPSLAARKAVPAPLNLKESNLSPSHEQTRFVSTSPVFAVRGGEYVPDTVERGRRRTREDDDRAREVIAIKDEEARSVSIKMSKDSKISKSASTTPLASPTTTAPPQVTQQSMAGASSVSSTSIPPSPRLLVNPALLLSPSGSESSMSSTKAQRNSIMMPLMSPGLPMSPRPGHRPANSPAPRYPVKNLSVSSSNPPLSPMLPPTSSSSLSSKDTPSPITMQSGVSAQPQSLSVPQVQMGVMSPSALPAPLFAKKESISEAPQRTAPAVPLGPSGAAPSQPPPPPERSGSADYMNSSEGVFRGFVSDQYPGLLLPPNALPLINVKVFSSRLRPSRNSILLSVEEDPVFILGIYSRANGQQLWRVEKTSQSLPSLHAQVKSLCAFDGKLPDASLFQGHSPVKIDARRAALNAYFDMILDTPLSEDAAHVVCHFFSTDVMETEKEPAANPVVVKPAQGTLGVVPKPGERPHKEGYLTKRGKNFGGWKARYFILDGPELKYYDNQGGPQIGVIRLYNAQIGKQSNNKASESPMGRSDDDNQYRHAILILEPKKKDSSSLVRHVLCAESDEERDAWVLACMAYVDVPGDKTSSSVSSTTNTSRQSTSIKGTTPQPAYPNLIPAPLHVPQIPNIPENSREGSMERGTPNSAHSSTKENHEARPSNGSSVLSFNRNEGSQSRYQIRQSSQPRQDGDQGQTVGVSYESTVQAEAPIFGQTPYHARNSPSSPSITSFPRNNPMNVPKEINISGPSNGAIISDMASWGMKIPQPQPTPAKEKKRSIFGFGSRGRSSSDLNVSQSGKESSPARSNGVDERSSMQRNPFGMPIAEAIELCPPKGVDVDIPAVVFRCLEYLRAMGAMNEEGLFRLSGSNVTIRDLKARFVNEGDVNLLDGDYYDVHAVASLLKLYLRELPNTILAKELHLDFLNINTLDDHAKKVAAMNYLVHQMPRANYSLIHALCGFLIEVVGNSDRNKMNVRNVGIVFAPTLNVPAWLISLFLTDYDAIFSEAIPEEKSPIRELHAPQPPSDGLRSPRHQMFSDISTPAYNQTTFSPIPGFQHMSQQPMIAKPHRSTYVPQSTMASHQAPLTAPHNEYAGPMQQQFQGYQQPQFQASQHQSFRAPYASNFPHPAALSISHPMPVQPAPQDQLSVNQSSRRKNRESAMMGMDIGLVGQRQAPRQTLKDTSSSRPATSGIY